MTSSGGDPRLDAETPPAAVRHVMVVPRRTQEVASARHQVAAFLYEWSVPTTMVEDLELVTSELVTNAIVHPDPSHHGVRVEVEIDATVTIEVANHGHVGAIPPVRRWQPAPPSAVSGRGLGIVRRLCDEVDVRQDEDWAVVVCRRRVTDGQVQQQPPGVHW